jgi:hypothetical protein
MLELLADIGRCGVDNRILFLVALVACILVLSKKPAEARRCDCGERK